METKRQFGRVKAKLAIQGKGGNQKGKRTVTIRTVQKY